MNIPKLNLLTGCALSLCLAGAAHAAVTPMAYYRLGENDPGAVPGGAANPTTEDATANSNDLTLGAGTAATYAPGIATGSTLALDPGSQTYSRPAFTGITDNFGLEGYLHVDAVGRVVPVLNGNGGTNGVGFFIGADASPTGLPVFQAFYGGQAFLPTNVNADAGDTVYLAVVRNQGQTTVYLSENGGPLQSFNHGGVAPVSPGGGDLFSIGNNFDGQIDEVRLFTFEPGAFSTADLLFPVVPEPGALGLLTLAAGLMIRRRRRA